MGEAFLKSLPACAQMIHTAPSQWRGVQVSELGCCEWWRHEPPHREGELTILISAVLNSGLALVTGLSSEQLTARGTVQDAAYMSRG